MSPVKPLASLINARLGQDDLRIFLAVAQLSSFSGAAEVLYKSTSAVSYRIKMLEEALGVPLFIRTTRSVALTPAGEFLYEKASHIFSWLQALPEEIREVSKGVEANFNLVINNLLYDADGAARLLAHLVSRFPYTQFNLRRQVYMGVWDDMLNNMGHLAIGAPGSDSLDDSLLAEPLGAVKWTFVVAPDHPLAGSQRALKDDELRPFPAINIEDTARNLGKRTAWKLPLQQEVLVPDMQTKIAAHIAGLGVGFVPAVTARPLIRKKQLVACRVVNGRPPAPVLLVWHRDGAGQVMKYLLDLCRANDPLVQWLFALLDRPSGAAAPQPGETQPDD